MKSILYFSFIQTKAYIETNFDEQKIHIGLCEVIHKRRSSNYERSINIMQIRQIIMSDNFKVGSDKIKTERKSYLTNKESYYFNYGFKVVIDYAEAIAMNYCYCTKFFYNKKSFSNAIDSFLNKIYAFYEKESWDYKFSHIFDHRSVNLEQHFEAYSEGLNSALAYVTSTLESSLIA